MPEPKKPAPKKPAPIEVRTLSRRVYHVSAITGEECATRVPLDADVPCSCGELLLVYGPPRASSKAAPEWRSAAPPDAD